MTSSYCFLLSKCISVLTGPPSIHLVTRSSDSLTVQIQLSDIGTSPILTVEMNITLVSELVDTVEWSGNFAQGELLDPVLVSTLQPSKNYTLQAVAVNQLGPGSLSMEFIFTEGMKILFHTVKRDDLTSSISNLKKVFNKGR